MLLENLLTEMQSICDMKNRLEEIKKEILEKVKDVELIFVNGSYAFGKMRKYSDIDMKVLTSAKPKREHVFRFVKHEGRSVLLTMHFYTLSHVLRKIRKPEEWIWAYMSYGQAKVLFDKNQNMEKIKAELERHKVSQEYFLKSVSVEASYLIEDVGKLKNAYLERDELNVFYAARTIAEICYNLLKPFNPVWKYASETETYQSFIELKNKPKHYVEDFKICYGLTMEKRSIKAIYESAMRLARETISFLRENKIEAKMKDREFLQFFNSEEYKDFFKIS